MSYRKITIKWNGVEYNTTVTMDLIDDMESSGVNPWQLSSDLAKGGLPPLAKISKMVTFIINAGGGSLGSMDVWNSINTAKNAVGIVAIANDILEKIFPPMDIEVDETAKK